MDYEKLNNRKYTTALLLAEGERKALPKMYEDGTTVKDIAEYYSTTVQTVVKALVFLGYSGPDWAEDAVKRTINKNKITPSNMKKTGKALI